MKNGLSRGQNLKNSKKKTHTENKEKAKFNAWMRAFGGYAGSRVSWLYSGLPSGVHAAPNVGVRRVRKKG